ncbi:MAG: hypothetical protein AB7G39_12735 [Alphaproteobacteria bacterium]
MLNRMSLLTKIALFTIILIVVGGAIFLTTWDIPAPSHQVEKVIDNGRFAR